MTVFAGLFSRIPNQEVPPSACETLRINISRDPNDKVEVFSNDRCFLAKVDIGVYGEPAFRIGPNGSVSMLAGEPLLSLANGDGWRSRTEDLKALHDAWDNGDWSLLQRVRGTFCAVYYQPVTETLHLIADKLCIRPLYYALTDEYVAFATSLRVLERLGEIPKVMDLRAITEIVTLGLPLGNRTPYANIRLLKAAELLRISEKDVSTQQYWRWDDVPESRKSESELLQEVFDSFTTAIAIRSRADTATSAFLSGGLDSRCVVAALGKQGMKLHTFNFARAGTQDQVFGAEFAQQIGSLHEEAPVNSFASPAWSMIMADAWRKSKLRSISPPERPNLFWSGDGGSVGFGHVYVNPRIVEFMRQGEKHSAIDEYLLQQSAHIPLRMLKSSYRTPLSRVLHEDIQQELDDIHCEDPGRSFYVFLLLNDQRRHLALHFEDIDAHRLELQLPFYDSDFLTAIVSTPIDLCLGHRFYSKWLDFLPSEVKQVPWQTYPGHEPCPLPIAEGLTYQWDGRTLKLRKRELLSEGDRILGSKDFPGKILNRHYLRATSLLYRASVRDYGYLIQAAGTYHKYWLRCSGQFVLDS